MRLQLQLQTTFLYIQVHLQIPLLLQGLPNPFNLSSQESFCTLLIILVALLQKTVLRVHPHIPH